MTLSYEERYRLRDIAIANGGLFQDTEEDCGIDCIPCGLCDICIEEGIFDGLQADALE